MEQEKQEYLEKLIEQRDALNKRIEDEERRIEYNRQLKEIKSALGDENQPDSIDSIRFVLIDGYHLNINSSTILYSKIINCIKNLKEKNQHE